MLPLELVKVILGALSRDDLDVLMLANASFRDIVLRDFAKEPYRYFAAMKISGHKSYKLGIASDNEYHCDDNDDFSQRMRLVRIGNLE